LGGREGVKDEELSTQEEEKKRDRTPDTQRWEKRKKVRKKGV